MSTRQKTKVKDVANEDEVGSITYAGVTIALPQEVINASGCGKSELTFVDVKFALHMLADFNEVRTSIGAPEFIPALGGFAPEEPDTPDVSDVSEDTSDESIHATEGSNITPE